MGNTETLVRGRVESDSFLEHYVPVLEHLMDKGKIAVARIGKRGAHMDEAFFAGLTREVALGMLEGLWDLAEVGDRYRFGDLGSGEHGQDVLRGGGQAIVEIDSGETIARVAAGTKERIMEGILLGSNPTVETSGRPFVYVKFLPEMNRHEGYVQGLKDKDLTTNPRSVQEVVRALHTRFSRLLPSPLTPKPLARTR